MRLVLSAIYWSFFALSCIPLYFVALAIFLVTFPFDRNGRILHLYSCGWAQLYFWVNPFWKCRVEGRQKLPWRGPAVLVANHASLADVMVLFALYRPFKWVSKKSVFKAPFLGWNMTLNRYVAVERGKRESVIEMLKTCEAWLDRGVPVLLFPEGTRSPDGEVKAFKDGAFTLAAKKNCPVIPIVLSGTARLLPKHGMIIRHNADCLVRVLDPVAPAVVGGDTERLREHVRELIVAEKRRIEAGGGSGPIESAKMSA